jgi:CRISPR-associated protein Cas5/CasD, subtype I-E/ECOLI
MKRYLLFRLFGPMTAWGDIAVGERRHVFPQPTKSAILGLVAGALGLRRTDAEELASLHGSYGFASRVDGPGILLTDFHTIQSPPEQRGRRYLTRREELAIPRDKLDTMLSYRDYQMDGLAVACIWAFDVAPYSLEQLMESLRRPVFAPYLGRRSCSPSLPFAPKIVEAESPTAALRTATFPEDDLLRDLISSRTRSYYWEGDSASDMKMLQTFRRRDAARSRVQWQFADRAEHHAVEDVSNVPEQD